MSRLELRALREAVVKGDATKTSALSKELLSKGVPPKDIMSEGLVEGMNIIGDMWKQNKVFIPEVLLAARALHGGLAIIKPALDKEQHENAGKVLIGTVKGDIHDIGKNIVAIMLEGAGFEVKDLGVDVPPETFASEIKENKPQILALSALLTTTMKAMEETIKYLEKEGLRDLVKVIVGGAPVNKEFADEIGADGYGKNAMDAVDLARSLVR